MNKKCRYIDVEGVCIITNALCNDCEEKESVFVRAHFHPFKNVTTIAIENKKGDRFMSCEIYGQLTTAAIKEYAIDMMKISYEKRVLK